MKQLGVPIRLDRPRMLLLDRKALRLVRNQFGIREDEWLKIPRLTLEHIQQLMWGGLVGEDCKLTYTKICLLVTHRNCEQFKLPLVKALLRGFDCPYAADESLQNPERTVQHG